MGNHGNDVYWFRPPKPGVELIALIDVLSKHWARCMVVSTTKQKIAALPMRQYLACLPTRVARRVFQSCLSTMTSNRALKKHFAWDEQAVRKSHTLISASLLATAQFELSMYPHRLVLFGLAHTRTGPLCHHPCICVLAQAHIVVAYACVCLQRLTLSPLVLLRLYKLK